MTESIKDTLYKALRELGISKKIKKNQILNLWAKVIGDEIQDHTEAKYFDRGTLFVNVDNSSWAHQLLFMKQNLMDKINKDLGEELVNEIRFKVGQISTEQSNINLNKDPNYDQIKLSCEEQQELEQTAAVINDENLRQKFVDLLSESKRVNKSRKNKDWQECPNCSVLIPESASKCSICELKSDKKDLIKRIEKRLYTTPWLEYGKLKDDFPQLNQQEFKAIKDNLAARLEEKLEEMMILALEDKINKQKLRVLVQNYVMLETGVNPENLTDRLIERIIGNNQMQIYNNL